MTVTTSKSRSSRPGAVSWTVISHPPLEGYLENGEQTLTSQDVGANFASALDFVGLGKVIPTFSTLYRPHNRPESRGVSTVEAGAMDQLKNRLGPGIAPNPLFICPGCPGRDVQPVLRVRRRCLGDGMRGLKHR